MSEILTRIQEAPDAPEITRLGKKGTAAAIRKMHFDYPELSHADIAETVGCTRQNVSGVLASFLGSNSPDELRDFQENKADVYDALQHRLLSSITQEKITKMKPNEAILGAAILEDKARLVRGQATGINVTVLMDVVDAIRNRPAINAMQPTLQAKDDGTVG